MVAQVACLVEGSNQYLHYYYHRRVGHFQYYCRIYFFQFLVARLSVGDSIRLLQLRAAAGRGSMAVGVERRRGTPWWFGGGYAS